MRGTRRLLHGGHVRGESPNMGGAERSGPFPGKTPQHAAVGKEVWAPLTGAKQNTEDYATVRKEGGLTFSSDHLWQQERDLTSAITNYCLILQRLLLWLHCCCHLPTLLKT